MEAVFEVIGIEVFIVFVLLLANGVFAMAEIAIVSSRKTRLQQQAIEGSLKAKTALDIANSPSEFLSTIQIGITLVGILSGAFGGATIAKALQIQLTIAFPEYARYIEPLSVFVVVVIITFFSIVIGELVPKRLALKNPEKIAMFLALPMRALTKVARPFERVLTFSSDAILKVLGVNLHDSEPSVTQEEVKTLVEVGTQAGIFEKSEQAMFERVLSLDDKKIRSIMTPRQDIVWLDVNESAEKHIEKMAASPHSHFPVADTLLDNLLGTVHTKDLYCKNVGGVHPLTEYIEQPTFIPESSSALHILEVFKRSRMHISFVIDEFGSIQGIVTLNDILEAIVGNLPGDQSQDEHIVERQNGSWYVDGLTSIDKFNEFFNMSSIPTDHKGEYETVAGLILFILGHIPTVAETFEWNGFRFEIADLDGNRIDKVIVTKLS